MFFCESCRVKRNWPQSYGGSYGRCEICGRVDSCYDMPSKLLPVPTPKAEPTSLIAPELLDEAYLMHEMFMKGWQSAFEEIRRVARKFARETH